MSDKQDPIFEFFRSVNIIQSLSQARLDQALPGDMLLSHFSVLNHLQHSQKANSPAELAEVFRVARPSMTNTLSKLEKMGLIKISADPNDGRGKLVTISTAGSKSLMEAMQIMPGVFAELVEQLGPDFFAKLLPGINKVRDLLDNNRS